MRLDTDQEPVLRKLRQALDEVYGENIARVVLYGSRARGDARPDSDYDVAVFLHHPGRFDEEAHRLAIIETDLLTDTDAVINALPFRADAWRQRTVFMGEVRRDGIDL
jgi:predicted nucleotidyltransferase